MYFKLHSRPPAPLIPKGGQRRVMPEFTWADFPLGLGRAMALLFICIKKVQYEIHTVESRRLSANFEDRESSDTRVSDHWRVYIYQEFPIKSATRQTVLQYFPFTFYPYVFIMTTSFIKRFLFLCLCSFSINLAIGQSIEGEWNGELSVPGMQLEMSISLIEGQQGWEGTLDIPVQNVQNMELTDLSVQGKDIYFELPKVPGQASYSGTFSDDYKSITGNFSQAGQTLALDFKKASEEEFQRILSGLSSFEQLVDSLLVEKKVPGMGIGIIKDGKIILNKGFGYRDYEHQKEVDKNTIFAIGSTTKAFVSAGLAILADEQTIDWNEPIKSYLHDFELHDKFAEEEMTALDLVTHRSGLPRHDLMWYGTDFNRKELFSRLKYLEPTKPFRTAFQYQNLMFMTAGLLIGEKSGSTWEEFTEEEIFRPLGMTSSNFSVEESQRTNNYALPYKEKDDEIVQMEFRNIDNVGPAGSINSSIADMLKWVQLQLNRGSYGKQEIIHSSQFDVMHTPQMIVGGGRLGSNHPEFSTYMYGAGWFIYQYEGKEIIQHGGNIDGFSAYVQLLPEEEIGMVFLTNKNGTKLHNALAMEMTDILIGKEDDIDWVERAYPDLPEAEEEPDTEEDRRKQNTKQSLPLVDYGGEYTHPAYGSIFIKHRSGSLSYSFNSFQDRLDHYHFDVFEGELTDLDQKIKLQFHLDMDGNIVSLSTVVEPMLEAVTFVKLPPKQLDDPRFIQAVEGEYNLGSQLIDVRKSGDNLKLKITGQPEYTLIPYQKDEFKLQNLVGFSVKFYFDRSRDAVKELVFYQPNGTFRATPK